MKDRSNLFGLSISGETITGAQTADSIFRTLYASVVDHEPLVPGEQLSALVRDELDCDELRPGKWPEVIGEATRWAEGQTAVLTSIVRRASNRERHLLLRRAALSCAPLSLAHGSWLQWSSDAGNADSEPALRMLSLYASDLGAGHPRSARGSAYLELLQRLRIADNAVPLARLVADQRIPGWAFELPGLLLLMGASMDDFRPYLVGADLCLRSIGLLPPLRLLSEELPTLADWHAIDPSQTRGDEICPARQSRAVAEMLAESDSSAVTRLSAGFGWALTRAAALCAALRDDLEVTLDPHHAMAELLRQRARQGAVYHQDFQLEGRPLTDWLKECRSDPRAFLPVLWRSRLVTPGRPENSPLITGLIGDKGPMFRVFSDNDVEIICRWISALGDPPAPRAGSTDAADHVRSAPAPAASAGDLPARLAACLGTDRQPVQRTPVNLREAYHILVTRTSARALDEWCHEYIAGWLARSQYGVDHEPHPLPPDWSREGLRPWLLAQHDQHSAQFTANAALPLPSRATVIDDAIQTAPLTLIDGSWLQGFTAYELASSEIGHSLFSTYYDELGNGKLALNHPRIYREVLRTMGLELPPTASAEFAYSPLFRDTSFGLPVYWLCIGQFPSTYLPEILGLNLAMELAGVGGAYRRSRMALAKHGFSTRFVDIHNTIDNVSTGHSAWAADAIDTLLSSLPLSGRSGTRSEFWCRVRVGYRSLTPPDDRAAWRAARRAASAWRQR